MSLLDFNRDEKVSNFEKAAGMAILASELERIDGYRKASPLRGKRNQAPQPSKPSRLDGAISVVAIIAILSFVLMIILALGLVFFEVDTSGMSYEEASRYIDFRYIPAIALGIVSVVDMIVLFILVRLAPQYEVAPAREDDAA